MENTNNIESYFLCILIKAELISYDKRFQKGFYSLFEYYTHLKSCFITLKNFKDLIQKSSKLLIGYQELLNIRKDLTAKLECIEYMRNKICGHIDDDFVRFAIKWNPHIMVEIKEDNKGKGLEEIWRVELLCKSLIESAINSYIADVPNQTIFKSEVDFFYKPSYTGFSSFVIDVIIASISFTEMFAKVLAKDINFYDEINLKEAYKEAGLMNFGIKLLKSKR
jgi:hypothetical protein